MRLVAGLVAGGVPMALGVLVLRSRKAPLIGWLLLGHGLFALQVGFPAVASTSRTGLVFDQVTMGAWPLLFGWLVVIAYLMPDGRPGSRFWSWWIWIGLAGSALFAVGAAGDATGFAQTHDGAQLPLRWIPEGISTALGATGFVLVVLLIFGAPVSVWMRMRRATGDSRQQLLWLVWGALAVPVTLICGWINHFVLDDGAESFFVVLLMVMAIVLPATMAIAVVRHRLLDIELVLSRTLTYALLVIVVVGVYASALAATRRATGDDRLGGLVAVGVVAVGIQPAYSWLRRRIERWVYGYRTDPHVALRLLADSAQSADAHGLVDAVTNAVAAALRVEGVWVEHEPGAVPALRVHMVHRGEHVGHLAIAVPPGREFSDADQRLVRDLAQYAAIIVRSEQLNEELRDSRVRIVAGREEERRRLRRDLHDGLGPSLAAVVLQLNAVESRTDVGQRKALLAETRDEVKAAIAEVRRLVDDLRPPAIDEVGLVDAIRHRASALSGQVTFGVDGPVDLPELPAAVEVAAFRIASEAMTNVVRHSGASRCRVSVSVGDALELQVEDNGHGSHSATTAGVGWHSMRERAAELGGTCSIVGGPVGGLLVRAVLPLHGHDVVESLA